MKSRFPLLLKTFLYSTLLTPCILGLSLVISPIAQAQSRSGYNPPPSSGTDTNSDNRGGGGTRGECDGSEAISLTTLAPQGHIGQTASTHPTFAWFVSASELPPMEFLLFEQRPGKMPERIGRIELQASPGIGSLSLPKDKPGLSVGKRYLWRVAIICEPNRPSTTVIADAEVDVVEMPPTLTKSLSNTTSGLERARLYARSGLWYDSFAEVLGSGDSTFREFRLALLEDLATLEESGDSERERLYGTRLRELVEILTTSQP